MRYRHMREIDLRTRQTRALAVFSRLKCKGCLDGCKQCLDTKQHVAHQGQQPQPPPRFHHHPPKLPQGQEGDSSDFTWNW